MLLLGVAESMTGPYLVLFGSDRANLSPFAIGVFVSLVSVSGIAVSTLLGRRYDRSPARWPALLAVIASAVGYLLLTTTTSYALLLIIAATFLGTGTAAFAQLFVLARSHLQSTASQNSTRGTALLRSVWSLAWAIGPMVGAALLPWYGFTGLFVVTAVGFAAVAVPVLLAGPPPQPEASASSAPAEASPSGRSVAVLVASFALFHTAMFAGSVVLPLYVTDVLGQSESDVGFLFSVGAAVEIPAALALLLVPARANKKRLILIGMALLLLYFVIIAISSNMTVLLLAQIARGVAIAVVGALGITYFQDLMPHATGRATTMFANSAAAGSLVSGVLAGSAAQIIGYRSTLLLCGALSALAWLLLTASRRTRPTETPTT
ncbi:sugar efflux transporter [Actinoplanes sp. Pm04-4]|uniref:Sugar efflux transporter n=1 Tax=Paractinoplanes pyxinae TaxID=2997416 RepID=A0ABT4BC11_9ACTN|nr:sugar efflux transporter [Actinoplanes pyxinae]MCY1144059.1 sugar efflux transporter [Actinoplanes pyxinae]